MGGVSTLMWCKRLSSFGLLMLSWKMRRGSSAASSPVGGAVFLSLGGMFSISCLISSGSMSDLRDPLYVAKDMTYYVSSYVCAIAPYGCSKNAKALAEVLTVPDSEDSGVVYNSGLPTLKEGVRFRGWTEIAECNASTASGLVECEPCEDEN